MEQERATPVGVADGSWIQSEQSSTGRYGARGNLLVGAQLKSQANGDGGAVDINEDEGGSTARDNDRSAAPKRHQN